MRFMKNKMLRALSVFTAVVLMTGILYIDNPVYAANGSKASALKKAYNATGSFLKKSLEQTAAKDLSLFRAEWDFVGLARSGLISHDSALTKYYYYSVYDAVQENITSGERMGKYSSENSRVIVALTALGFDPQKIAGHNLIKGLNDMDFVTDSWLTQATWALIALNTKGFIPPANTDRSKSVTTKKLVDHLVNAAEPGGGWNLGGYKNVDPDTTAMAIQALAPYYNKREDVKAAVDVGLKKLSEMQNNKGGYDIVYNGGDTSETISQVIVALTSLGIDPDTCTDFIKNGYSLTDSLLRFYVEGGGFKHILSGDGVERTATAQCYYALTSYFRLKQGKTFIYDMSDVKNQGNPAMLAKIKAAKFDKSSFSISYNSKTGKYSDSPLKLAKLLKLTNENNSKVVSTMCKVDIKWKITKGDKLATIDSKGNLTPKKGASGTVTVKATVTDRTTKTKTATCTVKISGPVLVKTVKVLSNGKRAAKLAKGKKITLTASVTPSNAKNKSVKWTVDSKGKKLVSIKADGNKVKVTAKKAGTAKITATAKDGSGKKDTFTLTIK